MGTTSRDNHSFIEKRRSRRVPAPTGATAYFKNDICSLDIVYVLDISEGGMLIYDPYPGKKYHIDLIINDIIINIPNKPGSDESSTDSKTSLFIDHGKVVRYFHKKDESTLCYGISFLHESAYVREKIKSCLTKL